MREGIHRHALLQVRPIWDPKTAAAIHVTKTAGVHTSHGGKTSAGRVSGGTPMTVDNMERRALMTSTQIESATAVQNVGRRLLDETVLIATKTYIQGKNRLYVTFVGKLMAKVEFGYSQTDTFRREALQMSRLWEIVCSKEPSSSSQTDAFRDEVS